MRLISFVAGILTGLVWALVRLVLIVSTLGCLLSTAYGQELPPVIAYDVGVSSAADTATPMRYNRRRLADIACDLPSVDGVIGAKNPTAFAWDDPDRPGRMCRVTVTDVVGALADGEYRPILRTVAADDVVSEWALGAETFARQATDQPPPKPTCTYTLTPSAVLFPASGGSTQVTVTTQAGCTITPDPLPADATWLRRLFVSPGVMTLTTVSEAGTAARATILRVNGVALPVTQAAAVVVPPPPPPPCKPFKVIALAATANATTWQATLDAAALEGYTAIGPAYGNKAVLVKACAP